MKMLSDKLYAPILKSMDGEFNALRNLSSDVLDSLLPIIRLRPPKKGETEASVIKQLMRYLKEDVPVQCVIDVSNLGEGKIGTPEHSLFGSVICENALEFILEHHRNISSKFIPLVNLGQTGHVAKAAGKLFKLNNNQLMVRVTLEDIVSRSFASSLTELLDSSENTAADAYLLVDFGQWDPEENTSLDQLCNIIEAKLNSLPLLDDWKSILFSSATFPRKIQNSEDTQGFSRSDWLLFRRLLERGRLSRNPIYSDCCTENPTFSKSSGGGFVYVHMRYTGPLRYHVFRKGDFYRGGNSRFAIQEAAQQITQLDCFKGANFSEGDRQYIGWSNLANKKVSRPTDWRSAATNHHITHVVSDLQSM